MASLETQLKQQARALGFDPVGIAPAGPADGFGRLREWLARGYAGEMGYMERHGEARRDPASILPEVRSVVMAALSYPAGGPSSPLSPRGRGAGGEGGACGFAEPLPHPPAKIARYARGADYHHVLRDRLKRLLGWLQGQRPGTRGRAVVDTAPLLERDYARRAGLGWFGKNTMLLNKRVGSYFFLGALLVDLELQPDEPHLAGHCGTCTACLDACPTGALTGPGWLDARRCISYLTIELRGPVHEGLRGGVGEWLFGCDVCQEVCPWNRKAPVQGDPAFAPRADLEAPDPAELLGLSEEEFRHRFRGTALTRAGRGGLLRNAALVLGNTAGPEALPALTRALADPDPLVREAARWAVVQIERRSGRP